MYEFLQESNVYRNVRSYKITKETSLQTVKWKLSITYLAVWWIILYLICLILPTVKYYSNKYYQCMGFINYYKFTQIQAADH